MRHGSMYVRAGGERIRCMIRAHTGQPEAHMSRFEFHPVTREPFLQEPHPDQARHAHAAPTVSDLDTKADALSASAAGEHLARRPSRTDATAPIKSLASDRELTET